MRHRATILSLVAIAFATLMVLPVLGAWFYSLIRGVDELWILVPVSLLLLVAAIAVCIVIPRYFLRR